MIIVQLDAGLGNQLFQYAAARRLALAHGTDLKLDLSKYPQGSRRRYGLDRFNIAAALVSKASERRAVRLLQAKGNLAALRRRFSRFAYYRETHPNFAPEVLRLPARSVIWGYFQSEQFFADAAPAIRKDLTFKDAAGGDAARTLLKIRSSANTVSIHVRRGDYVRLTEIGTLPISYYRAALAHISARIGAAPDVFVFSDDIDWCLAHFDIGMPFHAVRGSTDRPHDDLRLMSACRHNIIANSSFSWWGAWLNPLASKIVVAPRRWFASWDDDGGKDMVPKAWMRV